jgi:23S rRNA pseudouridine2605 synthase
MKLISYLQSKLNLSRRNITWLIDQGSIFLNWESITAYNQEILSHDKLEILKSVFWKTEHKWLRDIIPIENFEFESKIIVFNKPMWYVVSKFDPNNRTIYEILPNEFKNYYYIWRLDKESHGLLLLTNDPKLVNEYEHPKNQIEKTYIVKIDNELRPIDIKKCLLWIEDEWEMLKIKSIEKIENLNIFQYRIILTEWKKRHIRRIFKSLWYRVLDLQRIWEWTYKLWNIKLWERELAKTK